MVVSEGKWNVIKWRMNKDILEQRALILQKDLQMKPASQPHPKWTTEGIQQIPLQLWSQELSWRKKNK